MANPTSGSRRCRRFDGQAVLGSALGEPRVSSVVAGALQELAQQAGERRPAAGDKTRARKPSGREMEMTALRPLVSVVDDDESVRESLPDLLKAFGFSARAFVSAEDFLASDVVDQTRCLLLDIAMPGMTGPELQKTLAGRLPIVFITAHADDATRSRVIEAGAVACLLKPFTEESLFNAVNRALGPVR